MVFNTSDKILISWSVNKKDFEQRWAQLKMINNELEKTDFANSALSGGWVSAWLENDTGLMNYYVVSYCGFNNVGGGFRGAHKGRYHSTSDSGYNGDIGIYADWGTASHCGSGGILIQMMHLIWIVLWNCSNL